MRREDRRTYLRVSLIADDLADVVQERREHDIFIRSRSLRTSRDLERVLQLADVTPIGDVTEHREQLQYLLGPPAGLPRCSTRLMLARADRA